MRPTGTATNIAMLVINMVPVNRGTAPKLPDEPTWSARIAVCGLQFRPNRNSVIGTFWKNRIASKRTDNTMPTVVKIAILDAAINISKTMFSTRLRARRPGRMRRQAMAPPRPPRPSVNVARMRRLASVYSLKRTDASLRTSSTVPLTASPVARF